MKFTVDEAWELLNDMRTNKETWSLNLGNKGGTDIESLFKKSADLPINRESGGDR